MTPPELIGTPLADLRALFDWLREVLRNVVKEL